MATPQAPLLTRIALTANWDAGYALLLDEPGWPPAAMGLQDEFDPVEKNRWINRRRAMRRLAGAFGDAGAEELRRGARLLATDPACGPDCSTIAARLSAEMSDHNLTEAAADAIKGWAALSEGCPNTEEDPIKAAHAAAKAAVEYEAARAEFKPTPTDDELVIAPIIDDWEIVQLWLRPERRSIRGQISGHDELPYGSIFVADMIEVDLHHRWVRTAKDLYRLGYRKHELAPIVRAALKPKRNDAYNLIFGITGNHTLESAILKSARAAVDETLGSPTAAAKVVAERLYVTGRVLLAHAWYALAASDTDGCIVAAVFLAKDAGDAASSEVKTAIMGWQALADGLAAIKDLSDPFSAALGIGGRKNLALPAPDGPGVIVLREVGGTKETTTAKEAVREFKNIVGVRIPLALAPDMAKVRRILHDEFPHACAQIDPLLAGMIEGKPIKWRSAILVGSSGAGKSRLVRRLAEVLGVGLHRVDGAAASDNAFAGTARRWSSGQHCTPLEAVRRLGIANPLLLVDEIDKAGLSQHNGNLCAAILPFMDPETARAYPDLYVDAELDLSHVGFLLTCNSDANLSQPLRDRIRTIRLPDPGREHLLALVRSIVTDLGKEDPRWTPMLDDGECAIAETLWAGGSVRRLVAIVERILDYREAKPRN
jgi:hypothetical protein